VPPAAVPARSMLSRFAVPLLCAAAIALACGPRANSAAETTTAATPVKRKPNEPVLATSLDVKVQEGVALSLHVTNNDRKRVELQFPSGQTHDFVVLDASGAEVWRWSSGRLFTQALQNRVLEPHESTAFSETWDAAGRHGTFTAVATLTSANFPLETRVEFTLP